MVGADNLLRDSQPVQTGQMDELAGRRCCWSVMAGGSWVATLAPTRTLPNQNQKKLHRNDLLATKGVVFGPFIAAAPRNNQTISVTACLAASEWNSRQPTPLSHRLDVRFGENNHILFYFTHTRGPAHTPKRINNTTQTGCMCAAFDAHYSRRAALLPLGRRRRRRLAHMHTTSNCKSTRAHSSLVCSDMICMRWAGTVVNISLHEYSILFTFFG